MQASPNLKINLYWTLEISLLTIARLQTERSKLGNGHVCINIQPITQSGNATILPFQLDLFQSPDSQHQISHSLDIETPTNLLASWLRKILDCLFPSTTIHTQKVINVHADKQEETHSGFSILGTHKKGYQLRIWHMEGTAKKRGRERKRVFSVLEC